jgi:glycosyltransferase involved in cell wall biosynthesis
MNYVQGAASSEKASTKPVRTSAVIPVYDSMHFLKRTVPAFREAAAKAGDVELVFVDNGSSDGSYEYLCGLEGDGVRVLRLSGVTIAAVRNHGARLAAGEFLSFLDADCLIGPDYFLDAVDVIRGAGAAATGCEVGIPDDPHWTEASWDHLHFIGRDRSVHYLNSGNFFVDAHVFRQIGGFDEDLVTGEDAEIGSRILRSGGTIYESTRVCAVHLGNPKSLGGFYRRTVWHGLGMFGTVRHQFLDKPTIMTVGHLALTLTVPLVILLAGWGAWVALVGMAASQVPVPLATVLYRLRQTGRRGHIMRGIFLYWLYYWARIQALLLVLSRQDRRYRK